MTPVIVFDLDDTLYPEREFALSGFRAVGAWLQRERGIEGLAEVARALFDQGERRRIFDEALARFGLEDTGDLVAAMVAVYRSHEPSVCLYPDARRALMRLREDARLGLITDGRSDMQRRKVAALGVATLVEHVIYTDELGRACWKPKPTAFRHMMTRVGAPPEACVYVGDNPAKDFIAPNRLGWLSVRIRRPGTEHAQAGAGLPIENHARREIASLDELPELLATRLD